MPPIDAHAHVVSDALVKTLVTEAPEVAPRLKEAGAWHLTYPSGRGSGPVPAGMFDLTSRVADMDRQGVAVQAVSVPPTHFFYDAAADRAALHNDAMVDLARQVPDRFRVLATLPLASPAGSVEELGRLASEATVVGVELGTNVNGGNLDHPDLTAVWQAIADAGLAVVLHPDNVAGADRMGGYYLHNFVGNPTDTTIAAASLVFGGVLSAFPALRAVLLHGGGFVPYQLGRFSHGWAVRPEPRQRLQEPPAALFERFFFDTLTHDRQALRYLIDRFGPDRVAWVATTRSIWAATTRSGRSARLLATTRPCSRPSSSARQPACSSGHQLLPAERYQHDHPHQSLDQRPDRHHVG